MAFGNLARNKMRTTLTVMGVVVGIGAIIFLVSLGFGLQKLLIGNLGNMNALTVITVRRPASKPENILNDQLVNKFKEIGDVTDTTASIDTAAVIKYEGNEGSSAVVALEPKYLDFYDILIDDKKTFSGEESNEVIITSAVAKSLKIDDPKSLIGKKISYKFIGKGTVEGANNQGEGKELTVVGVSTDVNEKSAKSLVPIKLVKNTSETEYSNIYVKTSTRKQVSTVKKTIESMGYDAKANTADKVTQIENAFAIVRTVLFGFGFIALSVAAIGIFNTMTISLLERTHEIGIMKAIGGRDKDVARIFTAEASVIGLLGGIFGVGGGWFLGVLINFLANILATQVGGKASDYFYIPLSFAGWVVLFAFAISTLAGIWPARRASKLNPLEALRYE